MFNCFVFPTDFRLGTKNWTSKIHNLIFWYSDLKEQNAELLASKGHPGTASACHNCEQSSKQIAKMQQHISALQEALRIFQKSGDTSSGRL